MKPKLTLKQACFQGYPESAVYVQIPIGSRNSAIHNAYHTSLRPSSLFEPRHPSLKVVWHSVSPRRRVVRSLREIAHHPRTRLRLFSVSQWRQIGKVWIGVYRNGSPAGRDINIPPARTYKYVRSNSCTELIWYGCFRVMNDPTAGSPTVTLLRLHLPLNDKV